MPADLRHRIHFYTHTRTYIKMTGRLIARRCGYKRAGNVTVITQTHELPACVSRPDSVSLRVCFCVCVLLCAAYALSSDRFQCQISVSSAKANYSKRPHLCERICKSVCVFSATRYIILPLMSRRMLFPADSLGDTSSLSSSTRLQSPPPEHFPTADLIQHQVKELH